MVSPLIIYELAEQEQDRSNQEHLKASLGPLFVYNRLASEKQFICFDEVATLSLEDLNERCIRHLRSLSIQTYIRDKGLETTDPSCIIIADIHNPWLDKVYKKIIDYYTKQKIEVHFILRYGSDKEVDDMPLRKTAFFLDWSEYLVSNRDSIMDRCNVWLLDMTNEKDIYLENVSYLDKKIWEFLAVVAFNTDIIEKNSLAGKDLDNLSLFLTFGFCTLKFPVDEIREYLIARSFKEELEGVFSKEARQFERIRLKGDLERFYNQHQFSKVDQLIAKSKSDESLFVPYRIGLEGHFQKVREATTLYLLRPVDDENISIVNSTEMISRIDAEFQKYKTSEAFYEQGRRLDLRKKEVQEKFEGILNTEVNDKLTEASGSITYAKVFTSLLRGDESSVSNHLAGTMSDTFTTLSNVLADQREWFIGDEIKQLQRELDSKEAKMTGDKTRVEKLAKEVERLNIEMLKLQESKGSDNPDYIIKVEEKKTKEKEIDTLNNSFPGIVQELKQLKSNIDSLVRSFEDTGFRMNLKRKFEAHAEEKIAKSREGLTQYDTALQKMYQAKNEIIKERRKMLFLHFLLYPGIALLVTAIGLGVLWYYDGSLKIALYPGLSATLAILGYGAYLFMDLQKEARKLVLKIKETIALKEQLFNQHTAMLNELLEINFKWDCHEIGYEMIKDFKTYLDTKFDKLDDFYAALSKKRESLKGIVSETDLCDDVNEFSVVEIKELNAFYEKHREHNIIGKEGFGLSKYFGEFELNNNISSLEGDISADIDRIFNNRLNEIRVNDILKNAVRDIPSEVSAKRELEFLYTNSRSLLKTERVTPQSPYSANIGLGNLDNDFVEHLNAHKERYEMEVKWGSTSQNHQVKLLSIKSNFPESSVYDHRTNEDAFLNTLDLDGSNAYFSINPLFKNSIIHYYDRDIGSNPQFHDDTMTILNGLYYKMFKVTKEGRIIDSTTERVVALTASQLINYLRTQSGRNVSAKIHAEDEKLEQTMLEDEFPKFIQQLVDALNANSRIFNPIQLTVYEQLIAEKAGDGNEVKLDKSTSEAIWNKLYVASENEVPKEEKVVEKEPASGENGEQEAGSEE